MAYFVTPSASSNQITSAINYALANLGGSVSSNLQTGRVGTGNLTIGYLYQYMDVAYANSYDGSVGFSTSPTNKSYFGIRNTNSTVVSTNPTDYVWYQVAGGFGTTKFLWYNVTGGRNIQFQASATAPAGYYVKSTTSLINLDIITSTLSINSTIVSIFQWTSGSAPARPTTTSTLTWATLTTSPVPSGWSLSAPSDTTSGDVLWAIQVPVSANVTVPTSLVDWTNTAYPIVALSSNGASGATGGVGLSNLVAYFQQNQSLSPPSFASSTSGNNVPAGWSYTFPTTYYVGQVIWYIFGQYNSTSLTVSGVPPNTTYWTGPTAASIFQDIRSDNWNGTTPPTYGSPSTYGTTGYYISRNTGNVYFNNGIFRGDITGASGTFSGALSGATGTFAGSLSAATGTFSGSLSAATGTFSGSLSAATGTFSGTVSASTINSSTINSSTINAATINSASTFAGTVSAGTINSSTINSSTINAATINSDSTFAGTMNAGTINSSTINASTINSSSTFAGTVSAGTINSSTINSSTINSSTINAATINSASTFAGTVNAGTINSSTINSSTISGGSLNINSKFIVDTSGNTQILSGTSGARLLIQNNVIKVYDSSGTLRVQMGDLTA